jgi:hypothetical protein
VLGPVRQDIVHFGLFVSMLSSAQPDLERVQQTLADKYDAINSFVAEKAGKCCNAGILLFIVGENRFLSSPALESMTLAVASRGSVGAKASRKGFEVLDS